MNELKKKLLLKDKEVMELSCEEAFNKFERYLHSAIKSFAGKYEYEELFQTASFGLMKAYKTYDIKSGNNFLTYLSTVVNNELLMYNRKNKKHLGTFSLDYAAHEDKDGHETSLMEMISDETNYEEKAIESTVKKEMFEYISYLDPQEQTAIIETFFNNKNQREVAEILQLSQAYISRVIRASLGKLKEIYMRGGKMRPQKINRETLLNEVKTLGNNIETYKIIADKYGLTVSTVKFYLSEWKILKELKNSQETVERKETIGTKEFTKEIINPAAKPLKILKTTALSGKVMEYKVYTDRLVISRLDGTEAIYITDEEIETFIAELQELASIRKVS